MHRAPRITRAQAIALPSPHAPPAIDWIVAGLAVALLVVGLLAP